MNPHTCDLRSALIWLVMLLEILWLPSQSWAQEIAFPATLTRPAAQRRFEQAAIQMRDAHQQQLQMMAESLSTLAQSQAMRAEQQQSLKQIIEHLRTASDAAKAIEHAVQMVAALPTPFRSRVDDMARQFQPQLARYAELKRVYREYLAAQLAKAWPQLQLPEKRTHVGQLMALDNEQNIWLLARRPFSATLPLHASAKQPFEQYASDKRSLLSGCYSQLQPEIDNILAQARRLAQDNRSSQKARAGCEAIASLLASNYGRSMRGLMLLEDNAALPTELSDKIRAVCRQVDDRLVDMDGSNARLLAELDTSLKALRLELAAAHRFKDLIVIDTHRHEVSTLWRPLRIYATRASNSGRFEDAYLHVRRGDSYEVEFLVDGQLRTIGRADLWLTPSEAELPPRMLRAVPTDGPGQPVTATTKLDIEVLCHSPRGWQPAHVIDESPFGVELVWQSTSDPWPLVEPREHLRMVPLSQP